MQAIDLLARMVAKAIKEGQAEQKEWQRKYDREQEQEWERQEQEWEEYHKNREEERPAMAAGGDMTTTDAEDVAQLIAHEIKDADQTFSRDNENVFNYVYFCLNACNAETVDTVYSRVRQLLKEG